MSSATTPLEIAHAYTQAWTSGDLETARGFVAEDVIFDGPMQQSTGIGPYVEGITKLSSMVQSMEFVAEFGDAEKALLMYELHTADFGTLLCSKCLWIRDGKIWKDRLAFDASPMKTPSQE